MMETTIHLVEALAQEYAIDRDRLYATGQSGGCMMSIAMNLAYPDLFAASCRRAMGPGVGRAAGAAEALHRSLAGRRQGVAGTERHNRGSGAGWRQRQPRRLGREME